MTKKIMIILLILTIIIISLFICKKYSIIKKGPFYLDSKYYNSEIFIKTNSQDIKKIKNESFVLFTYNNYCSLPIPCEFIFEEFMKKHQISFISIPIEEYKKTEYYKKVKYAPSIILVNHGHIIAYLDANSNEDLDKYQSVDKFEEWIKKYIYLKN